jgi:hypothetical protein
MSDFDDDAFEQRDREDAAALNRFAQAHASAGRLDPNGQGVVGRLYHYTTLTGLAGIIDDTCFWASDVRYMNDASELSYATELIDEEVQKVRSLPENREVFEPFADVQRLGDPFEFEYGPTPFIACFCEVDDLLSQWRGYGPSDSVSLEIDIEKVAHLSHRSMHMRKVVYNEGLQRTLATEAIATWLRTARELITEGWDPDDLFRIGASWALGQATLDYHLCFKHPTFSEEREWRLIKLVNTTSEIKRMTDDLPTEKQLSPVISMYPPEDVDILFRRSAYGFTPYVEVPATDSTGNRVPITAIRQGPRSHADIALQSLALYMRSKGYNSDRTQVGKTGVPLRR